MLYQWMLTALIEVVKSLVKQEIKKLGGKRLAVYHTIDGNIGEKRGEALRKVADKFNYDMVSADEALVLAKTLHSNQIARAEELNAQRRIAVVAKCDKKVEKATNKEGKILVAISNLEKSLAI